MNKELVSAIITTHDRDPEIVLRAVNSVLNQTYDKIELIVVDDSSDHYPKRNAVENAVKAVSSGVVYIRHAENQGPCAARNAGLAQAKGYYVAFLDDDDEWVPDKIDEQLKGFSDDNVALVYGGITIIDEVRNKKYAAHILYNRASCKI